MRCRRSRVRHRRRSTRTADGVAGYESTTGQQPDFRSYQVADVLAYVGQLGQIHQDPHGPLHLPPQAERIA